MPKPLLVKSTPETETACQSCGTKVWPRVRFHAAKEIGGHVLCIVCLGRAIELVTGWRMMRMYRQWTTLAPAFKSMSKKEKARLL